MNPKKVALIGSGLQAIYGHLPVLLADQNSELVTVIDPSPIARKTVAKAVPSISEYENLEKTDLSGIDCAIISSPTVFHYNQTKFLLNKGIHVFCEKPLAQTQSEAQELVDIARTKNLILQAGYNRRFQPVTQYIIEALRSGKYGKLNSVTIRAGSIAKDLPPSILDPTFSGGGILMDYAVHFIDRLCSWFPSLTIESYFDDSHGGAEANAIIKFTGKTEHWNDIAITLMISWTNDMGDIICLNFENVSLKCTINNPSDLYVSTMNNNTPFLKKLGNSKIFKTSEKAIDIKTLQWEEFTSRINGGREKFSSLADAVKTTGLVEECYSKRKTLELTWGF